MRERLLQLFSWEKFIYLLQNPRENPQETVLTVGIFIILPLILLIAGLLIYLIIKTPPEVKKEARRKDTRKKFWITVGLASLVVGVGFSSLFLVYSSQASYCRSCHQMQKEHKSWIKSSHRKVTCMACHQKPGLLGWTVMKIRINRMILLTNTKRYRKLITTRVSNLSCTQCHNDLNNKTVSRYVIKMSHKEPLKAGFRCADCHNTVGHGKAVVEAHYPSMNDCIQCHTGEKVSAKCSLCHTKDIGVKPRVKAVNYPKVHLEPLTNCRGCHPIERCTRCHGVEMPHPPGWLEERKHARYAAFEKKQVCWNCHIPQLCNECHGFPGHAPDWKQVHAQEGRAAERACMSCHTPEKSPIFCELCH